MINWYRDMSRTEAGIGWLSPSSIDRPENIITDATGNEVMLTSQELQKIKDIEKASTIEELVTWLGVETVEEAEAFLVEINTDGTR